MKIEIRSKHGKKYLDTEKMSEKELFRLSPELFFLRRLKKIEQRLRTIEEMISR